MSLARERRDRDVWRLSFFERHLLPLVPRPISAASAFRVPHLLAILSASRGENVMRRKFMLVCFLALLPAPASTDELLPGIMQRYDENLGDWAAALGVDDRCTDQNRIAEIEEELEAAAMLFVPDEIPGSERRDWVERRAKSAGSHYTRDLEQSCLGSTQIESAHRRSLEQDRESACILTTRTEIADCISP
jgi:hypothetical protein